MKKEEVKITSFQAENYRLQLLYITKEMRNGTIKKIYEVRENRKVVCSSVKYDNAAAVYTRCISEKLRYVLIAGEPEAIILYKNENKYFGKYIIPNLEAEKYIKSGKYICMGGIIWEKKKQ